MQIFVDQSEIFQIKKTEVNPRLICRIHKVPRFQRKLVKTIDLVELCTKNTKKLLGRSFSGYFDVGQVGYEYGSLKVGMTREHLQMSRNRPKNAWEGLKTIFIKDPHDFRTFSDT